MKIYISPSMQKYNAYAAGNTTEAEQCHRIGEYAEIALKRNGFDVRLADAAHSAEQNVAESNAFGADYHVCIHTNAANGKARDVVVFTSDKNTADKCAVGVYNAIDALDNHKSVYGIRPANYYEIKYTNAKCVYIEAEFHDNAELAKWIIANAERIGEAIAKGFCVGTGKSYIAKTEEKKMEFKTFTLEGAFDEGLVGLVCDGKFATSADFISAISSGEKVIVNAHDQSRQVVFDDEAPKYKIVDGYALIAIKAEKGHNYPVSIFVYNTKSSALDEYDGRVENGIWKEFKNLPIGEKKMDKFKDIENSGFKSDIEWAVDIGIANGYADGTFKPNEPCTRGMMCAFLHRLHDAIKEDK